jgi:hypothetical protein
MGSATLPARFRAVRQRRRIMGGSMKIKLAVLGVGILLCLTGVAQAQELSGKQILEKTIHRKNFKDAELKVSLEKTRAGLTKNIALTLYQKNYPDKAATLVEINKPEAAAGISFLTWDYTEKGKPDQKWYYLPAINLYKELNDEQGRKYEDQFGFSMKIFAIDLEQADYKVLGEEKVADKNCWKVESIMKDPNSPDGARILTWVNQGSFGPQKVQVFDKTGKLLREFNLLEEKKFGDSWQEMSGTYKDLSKNQVVKFQITDSKFNTGLADYLFLSVKPKARGGKVKEK